MESQTVYPKLLYLLLICVPLLTACPTNDTLLSLCNCVSGNNGIILDCSNNDASTITDVLIANQAQLGLIQQLVMQNASLTTLPGDFMRGLYVKRLDLSNNFIRSVDDRAFAGLENILQALSMDHNNLTLLPVDALSGMTSLLQLNLANNSIGDLDRKQKLRNVPKLYDLNLGDNRICSMHKNVLDQVKHSLQTLNLGSNCFTIVPASSLRGFKQLLALHLHNNLIGQIEPLAFMNLPQLNLINLANNQISTVHRQSFLNVPALRLIYLGANRIEKLAKNQFRHFEQLEMLDLTENQINAIPKDAFSNMPKLTQLYLGDNHIEMIDVGAFSNNTFVILMLSGNRLTMIDDNMLKGMGYLQQLSFKNNQLVRITPSAFHEAPALVMLDLSHNRIPDLPPATFIAQLNLFLIDLSHNQLQRTPYNAFNQRVVTVVLQENPLCCVERVHMLQNGVGLFVEDSEDIICGNAPSTSGNAPSIESFITSQHVTTPATAFRPIGDGSNINVGQQINTFDGGRPPVFQGPISDGGFVQDPNFAPNGNRPPVPTAPQTIRITQPPTVGIPSNFRPAGGNPQQPFPVRFPGQPANPNFGQQQRNTLPPDIILATGQPPIGLPQWTQPPVNPDYGSQVEYYDYGQGRQPSNPQWPPRGVAGQIPGDYEGSVDSNEWNGQGQPQPPRAPVDGGHLLPEQPTQWPQHPRQGQPGSREQPVLVESQLPDRVEIPTAAPATTPRVPSVFTKKIDDSSEAGEQFPFQATENKKTNATTANATTTIIICLTVVVVVMVAVFITLCIVRHKGSHSETRRIASSSSDASSSAVAARTSAYVAAQAAYSAQQYGSLIRPTAQQRGRPNTSASVTANHKPGTSSPQGNNQHTWIYTPGAYNNNAQHSYFK